MHCLEVINKRNEEAARKYLSSAVKVRKMYCANCGRGLVEGINGDLRCIVLSHNDPDFKEFRLTIN
jgi:hypothetical protein